MTWALGSVVLEESLLQKAGTSGVQMKTLAELKGLHMSLRRWERLPGPQKICYFQEQSTHSTPECLEGIDRDYSC